MVIPGSLVWIQVRVTQNYSPLSNNTTEAKIKLNKEVAITAFGQASGGQTQALLSVRCRIRGLANPAGVVASTVIER